MGNKGRIFAMDVDGKKLKELERRASRAGATSVSTKLITETMADDFKDVGDRLLIDSPCSGLGTLRRQPDLKWRLKPAAFERVKSIQAELLGEYPKMLKSGGLLVYATCSILPSENRKAVDRLIAGGGFELVEDRTVSPAKDGFDGFYGAALRKL
jgi:16S rRNA (cytosine967-C5)-methyltransferase